MAVAFGVFDCRFVERWRIREGLHVVASHLTETPDVQFPKRNRETTSPDPSPGREGSPDQRAEAVGHDGFGRDSPCQTWAIGQV